MADSPEHFPLWKLVRRVSESYGRRLQEHQQRRSGAKQLQAVSVPQFQYLQAIQRFENPTVGQLAAYFKVKAPSTTVLLKRLEENGFVRKINAARDGRVQQVLLTAKGRAVLAVQENAFKALAEDIAAILTEKELQQYEALTRKICVHFEKPEMIEKGELI